MISLMKGIGVMTESETKAGATVANGFGMPPLRFKLAFPGVFGDLLSETYSSSARSATDYGLKVIEISNANTASAIDFFAHLLGSKSVTDVFTLSAAQARKGFDTASAQNKELWALAQKLAVDTGEPVRKRVTQVFQKAS
jgi:hypothetical protein